MNNEERIAKLNEKEYQKIFGVTKSVFDEMLEILEEAYKQEHSRGGHPSKLSVLDKLVIMLRYYREYCTMENIAFDYGVVKSTIHESICWVEETLMKSQKFSLPSKRALLEDMDIEVVLVDATECEIKRPKKTEKILLREEKETYTESSVDCRCKNAEHNLYHSYSGTCTRFSYFQGKWRIYSREYTSNSRYRLYRY